MGLEASNGSNHASAVWYDVVGGDEENLQNTKNDELSLCLRRVDSNRDILSPCGIFTKRLRIFIGCRDRLWLSSIFSDEHP